MATSFIQELKRRNVIRVAAVYVIASWLLMQIGDVMFPALLLPEWTTSMLVAFLLLGFPISIIFAWAYEVKPEEARSAKPMASRGSTAATETASHDVNVVEPRKSIVVLPFHNMSPDPGDAYFSDGLTEELITDLSHLHSLRVISLNSAMALKDSGKDVRTIGRELDVQYVLEGSVRKVGNDLRITAQLIDAQTDEHLWAQRYDGVLDNVFEIQEETSRSIVGALNLTLAPDEDRRIAEHPIEDPRAYACHLQATHELRRISQASLKRALQVAQNGLDIVGENELLYSTMGEAYLQQIMWGAELDEPVLEKARDCAERAFALNSRSRHGLRLAAMIEYHTGDKAKAARLFKQVLAADPNDANALTWLISLYVRVGKAPPATPVERDRQR